ncbi:E3 ubiquitin-protein ligase BIG BROTHER-like [Henckelia pumila]|uniref:E3 ubiquitin-protein ligase BIG BROTHER-like n=1 Tax=Henckelia pumila TaxID=405737 RepID=UPI003C6DDF22
MSENREMEVHYTDGGCPYPVSEGFMEFFGGEAEAPPLHYIHMGPTNDQESAYWSMHMNSSYEFGLSGLESTSYYGGYGEISGMDFSRRAWEYPLMMNAEESIAVGIPSQQEMVSVVHPIAEESSTNTQDDADTQVMWQDDIDPDNMTYEELLDLGDAVGTQSRGLSQEVIDLLPTSKHKSGGIFSRRKSGDRCVICQMRYKRGDRQINLPCKHAYHADCGSKWLSINKTCPVCNTEVVGDELRH